MFSNRDWKINVATVGEAIEELSKLDPDMPIHQGFEYSVDMVVFNRGKEDEHLSFEEGGSWTEQEDLD